MTEPAEPRRAEDPGPGIPVHRHFERQAERTPDALAIAATGTGAGHHLTYGELNRRANRLAHRLIALGVGPEVPVAILAKRTKEVLLWSLAVLKAGGCYLPLDPSSPEARLAAVLEEAGSPLFLASRQVPVPSLPRTFFPEEEALGEESAADPLPRAEPGNLAYVIFTSGSTGRPKGVEVEHRALSNLVAWHRRAYGVTSADRATRLAGAGFDAAVWEVWPYLAAGASLHLPAEEDLLVPARLLEWLVAERITCAFLPTPLAEAVLAESWPGEPALRALLTGGDRLQRAPRPDLPTALYNHYGPTENGVVTTAGVVPPGPGRPTIGRPIDGVAVRLLDRELAPLAPIPPGEEGEMAIGGASLARGYRGRPERTAESFVPDPAGEPGARLYRSGDLARLLPGGELDFVGRRDQQVKVRGVRIELGEVEAALYRLEAVHAGAVLAREERDGSRRLVGYTVLRESARADAEALRAALGRELPAAMVPADWVFLPALPLTVNGKVDRTALALLAPEPRREALALPRTPAEEQVAAIFREVLGLPAVGVDEDFFALGGHSLRAGQVLSRVRARLGVELPATALFEQPTVAGLAARLAAAEAEREGPIPRVPRLPEMPLSFGQEGLWLFERWAPGTAAGNTPFALDLTGELDRGALGRAWTALVERHESLRTSFPAVAGQPFQRISEDPGGPPPLVDLGGLPEPERRATAGRLAAAAGRRPFDLAREPALRGLLLRLSPGEHRLLVLLHHIVSDDWTIAVLLADLAALYRSEALPELPIQYADFAAWQRRRMTGDRLARLLGFWRERLAGAPETLDLPADRPHPATPSFRADRLAAPLPPDLGTALETLGRRRGASAFMTLLAAWGLLLGRLGGGDDLLVGVPVAGRGRLELEPLAGILVNTLALRLDLARGPRFSALLDRVRESALAAFAHQELPFELLLAELRPDRDGSRSPLVQVYFVFANAPRPPRELAPGVGLAVREVETGAAKVDLSLYVEEREGELWTIWEASRDLFDRATVERLAAAFRVLLAGIAADPEAPAAELPLLDAAERSAVLLGVASPVPLESGLLHPFFTRQAGLTPDAVALVAGGERVTYGALAERSRALAGRLAALGVGPEVPVAVFLPRTADLPLALLAVLMAGGFYVPLDPAYPDERIAFLLEDSGADLILTHSGPAGRLPRPGVRKLLLDREWIGGASFAPLPEPDPRNLAYLIYTSGSTGTPKAVAITHASAARRISWARKAFSPKELAAVLAATSISFDLSVFELFAPLASGGTAVLAENALALSALPAADTVTLVNTVPSALASLLERGPLPASVRAVNLAGEPLPRPLADRLHAQPGIRRLQNLYGPSEDTTYSTGAEVKPGDRRPPAIGLPLPGTRAGVRDAGLSLLPAGVPGELCLSGEGLARGYRGRPETTAERFVPDPDGPPASRLYKTGDQVRLEPGGGLAFLGRLDRQVKLRGYRIEPGEAEATLARQPEVAEAAAVIREDRPGDPRLIAYVAPAAPSQAGQALAALLRSRMERALPAPLVPAAVVVLPRLPRTPNGKLDRRALPAPATPAITAGGEAGHVAPRTPDEAWIAALWAEVLGCERVSVRDDFFALGGHSLLAARLLARIAERLGREVPMRTLFEARTVERLAAVLGAELAPGAVEPGERPLPRADRSAPLPLSSAQRRLWFLDRLRPGGIAYNMPFAFHLEGDLRPAALAAALREVIRRHEALRTTFAEVDGLPVQEIGPPPAPEPELPFVDLSALSAARREPEAGRLAAAEAAVPFELARGPLLRTRLLGLGRDRHRLLWTAHHIVFDGESLSRVAAELAALYPECLAGRPPALPPPAAQVADFARYEAERLAGPEAAEALAALAARLRESAEALELPADRPRPVARSERGGVEPLVLPAAVAEPLLALAREDGATPFMALLAGFAALLGRLCQRGALRVGTPASLRTRRDLQGMVGCAVNTLVLPLDLPGAGSGRALLARVRQEVLATAAHRDLPFERLVEAATPERDLSANPLVQASFTLEPAAAGIRLGPGLGARIEEIHNGTAKYDLALSLAPGEEGVEGAFGYAADLFEPVTVRRWAGHLAALLAALGSTPDSPLADLPWLAPSERHQLIAEWNDTGAPASPELVHRRFAAQADRTPDAVAVEAGDGALSYRELDRQADRLAHRLRRLGAGPDTRVAVATGRSTGAIVALLGALKAGAAYLPVELDQPAERRDRMLAEAGAVAAVTDPGFPGSLPAGLPRVDLDAGRRSLAAEPDSAPAELAAPGNLAYVLFTSGSTGAPKAVAVEHRQLDGYVRGISPLLGLAPGAVWAHVSPLAVDLGHTALFPSLLGGGRLHLVPREVLADPRAMAELALRIGYDALKIVPSHLAALRAGREPGAVLPHRLLVLGGESPAAADLAAIRREAPGLAVLHHYGPTETTVGVLTWPAAGAPEGRPVPLGRPLPGVRVHLLDPGLRPLPVGVPGELHVAGPSLARGYLGHPDPTAERFLPDPLGETGGRLYRTGDRARRLPGGEIEFLGRMDRQVKIRGFRVEPGEVEAVLAGHPDLRESAVVALAGPAGVHLAGYAVPRAQANPPSPADLRGWLASRLPAAMLPAAWVLLDALPRTASGKIDRRALPPPEPAQPEAEPRENLERTPAEERLAGIWRELLGTEPAPGDDFFLAGGHSLLAARLVARLRDSLGVDLPVRAVFEAPTFTGLAQRIEEAREAGAAPPLPPIPRLPRDRPLPLSFAQERLWFLDRFAPGSAAYNVPYRLELAPGTVPARLDCALTRIVERHEVLRTRFPEAGGLPRAEVVEVVVAGSPLSWVDLSGLSCATAGAEADRLAAEAARRPFDLTRETPLRAALLLLGAGASELLLTLHHIAFDAASMAVLASELGLLYRAEPLPALPVQYADFAAWQRDWLDRGLIASQLAFWRERLAGAPPLELPADRPRQLARGERGARRDLTLPVPLATGLRDFARRRGATPFMALLAGYAALLSRLSGQLRLTVGTPIANRRRPELENLIGFFVNTLVLPLDLSGEPGLSGLLGRLRETTLDAHAHPDLPFERLVQELQPGRDLGQTPLFQAMLLFQEAPRTAGAAPIVGLRESDSATAKFDLTLAVADGPGALPGAIEYARDLFDETTMRRWSGHLLALFEAALAAPDLPFPELPLLAAGESQQLLHEWNDTEPSSPAPLLHAAFLERARIVPDAVALSFQGEQVTYGDLALRARLLARHLRGLGVGPEVRVGIAAERSPEMVTALLGTLLAGGAYLPLDPAYPHDRLEWMLADGGLAVLLTQERLGALLPPLVDQRVVFLDADWELIARSNPGDADPGPAVPENLAYILYTSGSTGRPKGVLVRHGGAARFLRAAAERPGLLPDDVLLAVTTLSFDISLLEIFLPLSVGARIEIASRETAADPALLGAALADSAATVLQATPATWRLLAAGGWPGHPGLLALSAGEPLPRDLADLILARIGPDGRLWNVYGPTETTVWSTLQPIDPGSAAISIGRPISGTTVHLLDRGAVPSLQVLPGSAGELCIGGEGLARGYRNRPDLTAERFQPDPFGPPGARLYKTGDLARRRPDGTLEHLGRFDDQVKVRGFRIELGEIESVLREHPAVAAAAVALREDDLGERRLAAYVVPRLPGLRPEELRAHLRQKLPDYMVPAHFVTLEGLPTTANGKLDRRALPPPAPPRPADRAALESRERTSAEELLAGIWRELMGLEPAPEDDFFAAGGHSLLAARLVAHLRDSLGVELPVRAVFAAPTFAALARRIAEARGAGAAPPLPPIQRLPRDRPLPLSFAQERLWFLDRFAPGSAAYNIPTRLELAPGTVPALLDRALAGIVQRHEILRTRFPEAEGLPLAQVVAAGSPLARVDLCGLPAATAGAEADRLAAEAARQPFDLTRETPLRAVLLTREGEASELLLTLHHIAFDAASMTVLARELGAFYRSTPLPPLPIQYADFAAWQRDWLAQGLLASQLAFWRERLAGIPPLELPADHPRPLSRGERGARRDLTLPSPLAAGLRDFARRRGATPFMALLAGYAALLSRLSGQRRFTVGTPIANRRRPELENLIGLFINTLVLPLDLSGEPGLAGLLARVRETTLDAHAHPDLPFERLVHELQPERDLGQTPLFQAMLLFQEAPRAAGTAPVAGFRGSDSATAKFDLTLAFADPGGTGGIPGVIESARDLFDESTIRRWSGHLLALFEAGLAAPDLPFAELPLLSAGERQQLLHEWNDTEPSSPAPLLHAAVLERARISPDAVALSFQGEQLSYGELATRARLLARHLRGLGVGPEIRVGIAAERSPEMVTALLGTLLAGGAYLPLDPEYPHDRLEWMLADGGLAVLLTQERLGALLPPLVDERVVFLDADWELVARGGRPDYSDSGPAGPENLAYILYTSGSTGRPKGVLVRHGGAARFLRAMAERPGLLPADVLLAVTTLSFDIALLEIFLPLSAGARVEIASRETAADPALLGAALANSGATALQATPATWRLLAAGGWPGHPGLLALAGGEPLPRDLADLILARIGPGGRLWNVYGPTETTVWSTLHPIAPGSAAISIGRPIAGTTVHLLRDGSVPSLPVPPGSPGELAIGGEGLARGYRNRPDLTAERFQPDPFGPPGARLYKTGDLARRRPDGTLEHLGRLDDQVKVRGFRIELGEIESVLREHRAVAAAAVAVREDEPGERRLAAYVVPRLPGLRPEGLRAHLRQRLPDYMVPALFVFLEKLPTTANGKLDRRALARLAPLRADQPEGGGTPYAPPASPAEAALAAVWAEVLRRDRVGRNDNFFDLGGDSILSIRLVSRAAREGILFTPRDLFRHPTIATLAARAEIAAEAASGALEEPPPDSPAAPASDGAPASADFPDAGLDQQELDQLLADLARD